MTKKVKYLVETSCAAVGMDESTAHHAAHFAAETGDGELWTSLYIRKEFIRLRIRKYIKIAASVEQYGTTAEALAKVEQEYGRGPKGAVHLIEVALREKIEITNSKAMGKEFGRLAIINLKKFDRLFRSKIQNSCGCKIGGKELEVDHNRFFEDLALFAESIDDVPDCPINKYLGLGEPHGRARKLLNHPRVDKTKAGENLTAFDAKKKWINCKACEKIGDAVIAIEQPPGRILVHIDKDFNILCEATGREHKQIKSLIATDADAPKAD